MYSSNFVSSTSSLLRMSFGFLVVIIGLQLLTLPVFAAERKHVGEILFAVGERWQSTQGQNKETPKRGSLVYEGDLLVTGATGFLQIRMIDEAFISLRSNSRLKIKGYVYDAKEPKNNRVNLLLEEGVVRSVTGKSGEMNRKRFRLSTPVAAIGVRGTDFTVYTNMHQSQVSVAQGGIVMTPFSSSCALSGEGPCEGGNAREFFAQQKGYLELRKDFQRPIEREGMLDYLQPLQQETNNILRSQSLKGYLGRTEQESMVVDKPESSSSDSDAVNTSSVSKQESKDTPRDVDTADDAREAGSSDDISDSSLIDNHQDSTVDSSTEPANNDELANQEESADDSDLTVDAVLIVGAVSIVDGTADENIDDTNSNNLTTDNSHNTSGIADESTVVDNTVADKSDLDTENNVVTDKEGGSNPSDNTVVDTEGNPNIGSEDQILVDNNDLASDANDNLNDPLDGGGNTDQVEGDVDWVIGGVDTIVDDSSENDILDGSAGESHDIADGSVDIGDDLEGGDTSSNLDETDQGNDNSGIVDVVDNGSTDGATDVVDNGSTDDITDVDDGGSTDDITDVADVAEEVAVDDDVSDLDDEEEQNIIKDTPIYRQYVAGSAVKWGRWSDFSQVTGEATSPRYSVHSHNKRFILFKKDGTPVNNPSAGVFDFKLAFSESVYAIGDKIELSQINNAKLSLDFDQSTFATSFDMSSKSLGQYHFSDQGSVDANGNLQSGNVSGFVSNGASEAGYIFERDLGADTSVSGMTFWVK
jgi:hypothetical protein